MRILHEMRPSSLGFGDVKHAPALGVSVWTQPASARSASIRPAQFRHTLRSAQVHPVPVRSASMSLLLDEQLEWWHH
ncbi:MAG: hypothetical protein OXE79_00975 [Acidimicrobiaceae bacterium]|nr:hypothetical protein [Acidimicrobiaceae bacterium]MCY4176542.1 hypothetical protein [Acidimicrobiaceae bacterium]MCY4281278.1 hypothetical protein [Acidimicrobiaceae bacterium]MCY4293249.1 hypothetical protein [Acidimicrobiaceae bacterium]